MAQQIGFIGLGNMGLPMASNLAQAGHPLHVYDVQPAVLERAAAREGITAHASAAEVATHSEVLFTCLPNNEIVRRTYLDARGVAEGGHPGLITCDASTVSPEVSRELHASLHPKGIRHMDTPMLGSSPQAVSGEIFFIVAGDEENVSTIAPLLEVMGKMHMYVGPSGTANQIKLIHNALGAVNSVAVAESLALCVKAGVDPETYFQVVRNGGGMAYSTYFERRVPRVLDGEYSPTFTLELMHKDVTLASEIASQASLQLPILQETLKAYAEAREAGWGKEDFSAVSHVLEKRIGRKIAKD